MGDGGVPSVLAVDANGVPVFSIDTVRARPVERGALEAARRGSAQQELYELQWTKLSTASPSNGSALRVAILEPERQQDEHEDGERQHDERKGHEGHEGPERRERQQDEHEDQEREWDGREGWEWVFGELSGLSVERYVGLGGLEGALERGVGLPGYVVVRVGGLVGGVGGGLVGEALLVGVHAVSECVLGLLNAWLAGECFVGARLVFVTEGALVARDGEVPDLVQAPLVGLLRSAHSEHPERFSLIDIDSSQASRDQLYSALVSHESELAIRDGSLYAPRLTRVRVDEGVRVAGLGLEGTVLVSGGTGGLGAVLARHLVVVHGVRRLLLMSRSGLEARGAGDLLEELVGLGCQVDVVACDVTDRAALERVIARVPVEHPISAVVHTAGVIDDGVISSLDSERLRGVMAPKVDGALNLHELTQHLALSEFILFSSAPSVLGSPGQGNYAAANAFLDALAYHRRALGLPGLSLAWGLWASASNLITGLNQTELESYIHQIHARLGVLPLSDQQGLELIDVARVVDRGLLLPVRLDSAVLRTQARMGLLPAALSSLVRAPVRRSQDSAGSLARRLAGSPEGDWDAIVLELTLNHVAALLGHTSPATIDPQCTFKGLGADSLFAIELRNRLSASTGLKLPPTVVFDCPTPAALAKELCLKLSGNKVQHHSQPVPGRGNHMFSLDAEALLTPDIWLPPSKQYSQDTPSAVLLTGATGFLGAHLLHELLERTDAKVWCLVRASDTDEALVRILAAQRAYVDWSKSMSDRIIPIAGDLAQPSLGMSEDQFQQLAADTDIIFHVGASVNHLDSYEHLKAANVGGTREILRLACTAKPLPVHYVLTLGFVDPQAASRGLHVTEDSFMLSSDVAANGYVQSKWVADRMVTNARSRGLITSVYRPGLVLGHSVTGVCNTMDTFVRIMRANILLGATPRLAMRWVGAPVDYVSGAIAELALSPGGINHAYHLIHSEPLNNGATDEWMRDFGYTLEELAWSDWMTELKRLAERSEDSDLEAAAALIEINEYFQPEPRRIIHGHGDRGDSVAVTYDCTHAEADLLHSSVASSVYDAQCLHASLRYLIATKYLDEPT